jgi:hypothetical protein
MLNTPNNTWQLLFKFDFSNEYKLRPFLLYSLRSKWHTGQLPSSWLNPSGPVLAKFASTSSSTYPSNGPRIGTTGLIAKLSRHHSPNLGGTNACTRISKWPTFVGNKGNDTPLMYGIRVIFSLLIWGSFQRNRLPKKPLKFLMQSLQFIIPGMVWGIQ